MGFTAAIIGALGGLTAVLGVLSALHVAVPFTLDLPWTFWFALAAILLLASIAFAVGRGSSYE